MLSEDIGSRTASLESYRERITNFSNEFDLGLFLYIFRRSLIWIFLCILLSLAAAYIYLRYTAPTFESRSILQVSESNTATKVLQVNQLTEDKNLLADVELLRSKFFIAKALERLPLKVSYFYKGQVLTHEYYTQCFFEVRDLRVLDPQVLDVPVVCEFADDGFVRLTYAVQAQPYSESHPLDQPIRTPHFSCTITVSALNAFRETDPEGTVYFKINDPATLVVKYAGQLGVRLVDNNSKIIEIACKDHNPVLARDLAQAMADTYIRYDVERKSESAESILHFIETQKDTVFEKLRDSEFALQRYKQENKVADMEQLTPLYLERTQEYEDKLIQVELDLGLLEEIRRSIGTDADHEDAYHLIPLLVGTEMEETIVGMIEDLNDLLMQREQNMLELTEEAEGTKAIDHQIAIQKRLLVDAVNNLTKRFAHRKEEYERMLAEFDRNFRTLPEKELQYARYERLFNINEKYYTLLLEKDIEYRISRAGFVPDNRILEPAVLPLSPIAPNRNVVLFSYLVTGVIVSLVIVLLRYILHDNVTSLNDIAKLSSASIGILGMVPKYKKEIPISQLLVDKNPKSLIAESFRSVRTNLQFVDNTPGPKVIAITSTISGEGKTFVAINLAGIISFSGKRVIVLDLDMRKPKIHLGFGVENVRGMSTLLINKDTLDDCIQASTVKDLHFITAGPIPPNPSELIISPRMKLILDELKTRYDIILIDNPPVGLVTDGIAMIQIADYPIYIFRADYSKKAFIHNVDRLINENKITRMSTILNGVDVERNKYGYNYGYGYGYGYGYSSYGSGYYDDRGVRGRARRGRTKLSRILKGA